MSSFTNILVVSPLPDGLRWVLRKSFSYDVGSLGSKETITVPENFVTDFATVPRFMWTAYPKWSRYGSATIIHDYLYYIQKYTRKRSDQIFREALEVLEISKTDRFLLYSVVRAFGGKGWKRRIREIEEGSDGGKIYIFDE
jgi:hypothetical protein